MKLAPNNAGLLFARGCFYLKLDLDFGKSQVMFERFLKINPGSPNAHYFLAEIDLREGRIREALRRLAIIESDMTILGVRRSMFMASNAFSRWVAGDYERALARSAEAMKLVTDGERRALALTIHAVNLLALDRVSETRALINEAWDLNGSTEPERYLYLFARTGETGRARDILTDSRYDLTNHFFLALGHLELGDIDKTFASIRAGIENHNVYLLHTLIVAEHWDPIRDDPRFDEMLALLDAKVTHTEQYLRDHKISQAAKQ